MKKCKRLILLNIYIYSKANTRNISLKKIGLLRRHFTCTSYFYIPKKNDQDNLIEEIQMVDQEFNEVDGEIEELNKEVIDSEEAEFYGEDETELSQFIKEREQLKDEVVGQTYEDKDEALFEEKNERKDNSLTLEMIQQCTERDIDTLSVIMDNLPQGDPNQERASEILEKLETLDSKVSDLRKRWHENDLAPIPQDSSDIHQTEFNSWEPFDE